MIGVAIGTYGDKEVWKPLAMRAMRSVQAQSQTCFYHWVHDEASLQLARNSAANLLTERGCDWLIFLDAEDELHPEYVASMALAASLQRDVKWPILQPSTLAIVFGVEDNFPYTAPAKESLLKRNLLPLGCMHKAEMFIDEGGFTEDLPVFQAWAYWLDSWINGAEIVQVPDALYRVHTDRVPRTDWASIEVVAETRTKIRAMYSLLARHRGLV